MSQEMPKNENGSSVTNTPLTLPRKTASLVRRIADDGSLLTRVLSETAKWTREQKRSKGFYKLLRRAASEPEFLESLQLCRDAIIRSSIKQDDRARGLTVAIAGADGTEGATYFSLLLTLALGATPRYSVAYLDCSFGVKRFNALTKLFSLAKNCTTVEKGDSQLLGYYNERYPNLYFLKQKEEESSLSFFSERDLQRCISQLHDRFDFTVVDMPPLLTDSSANFVTPIVDQLYLVVSAGKTRLAQIDRCMTIAEETGSKIAGVVVNEQSAPLWSKAFWREFFF